MKIITSILIALLLFLCHRHCAAADRIQSPGLEEALAAKEDLYGDAAMLQTNGPSYEYFAGLIPPLRYVSADFQHYPLLLSAPGSRRKGRYISNGSGINLKANTAQWNETGTPVSFRIGPQEMLFGDYIRRVDGPYLQDGYLPIYRLKYVHGTGTFGQEVFASVTPELGSNAVALVRFDFKKSKDGMDRPGVIQLCPETKEPLKVEKNRLLNDKGEVVIWFDENWKWMPARGGRLVASLKKEGTATVAIATQPVNAAVASPIATKDGFEKEREQCARAWQEILARGVCVEIPEPVVNNAWRSCVLQNFGMVNGNRIHYSAGNQYDKLYEGEGSDTATAFAQYGYEEDVRRFIVPLLDFTRKGLEYHQAGHKLEDICRYYWQTRDAEFVQSMRPRWEKELKRLMENRTGTNGLYPMEQYCGDIPTNVFSLNSNANGWRAMRDTAAMLSAMGEKEESAKILQEADAFRKDILKAIELSRRKNTEPPFVPLALYGKEEAYDFIPATKIGGYWNLMANYILASHVFGIDSKLESDYITYLQKHGGLVMGMTHGRSWPSWWEGPDNNNLVYGMRYALTILRKDEPERALVSFYGMLAQGMTRDTFNSAESAGLRSVDNFGRQLSLPPNSAANASFLQILRNLLVQDLDLNDDGEPETLRLMFATSRRWLEDGKTIKVERAPTAFGPVSVILNSKLSQGEVTAAVSLPQRQTPKRTLLRVRVPEGRKVISATTGTQQLKVDDQGTVDISSLKGKASIRFQVKEI